MDVLYKKPAPAPIAAPDVHLRRPSRHRAEAAVRPLIAWAGGHRPDTDNKEKR